MSRTDRDLPSRENLAVCGEHGIMTHARDEKRLCALCVLEADIEVRRDGISGQPLNQQEVRQRIEAETLIELLPIMQEYVADRFGGDVWVTVERFEGTLPAGYTEAQERWVNAVGYMTGSMEKCILTDHAARQTIETLRENGYGSAESCTENKEESEHER